MLRVGIDRGPSWRALRPAHIEGTFATPASSPLSSPFFFFFFLSCFAFSHALFLASFMRPGDLKITVSRRFENWVVFTRALLTRVRQGVESTVGLTIQTWMKTHKLTDLLFPRPQTNFFIPVSFIVLRTWLSAIFDVGSTNVSVPVKGGEKVTKEREIDRKIHAFPALGGSKAVL